MKRLENKTVIMTGAAGGICGKASEYFCKEGAQVVMVDKNPLVEEICATITANGGDAVAVVADVSKKSIWEDLLAKSLEKYGKVDCVVNGAAEFYNNGDPAKAEGFQEDRWDTVIDTNLKSMLWSYQVILPHMIEKGIKGNFINFSSAMALSYLGAGCEPYAMSKAGILISTKDMVKDYAPKGIRFNCLAPNAVWTPASDRLYHEETALPWFRSIIPTPPHYAPADAPAPLMAFLASDEAYWINGVCIPIDGGWSTCN